MPNNSAKEAKNADYIIFALVILLLCFLPFERLMLPHGLRIADIAFISLILYGLKDFLLRDQQIHIPLGLPMALILLASLLSTLTGFASLASFTAIIQEIYLFVCFIFLMNLLSNFSIPDLNNLMKIWSVIALVEAGIVVIGMLGVGPHIFYTSPVDGKILSIGGLNRGIGTFINPNAAAAYLSISLFVVLATSWPIFLRAIFGIWICFGIFATGSMGGILSTLLAFTCLTIVYLFTKQQNAARLCGILVCFEAVLVFVLIFSTSLWPSVSSVAASLWENDVFSLGTGRLGRSFASRLNLFNNAWNVYQSYPLGTGPNTSAVYLATLHNDYIAFLFERGPLGIIGWLYLIWSTLGESVRAAYRRVDNLQCWRMLALGAAFLGCMLNALVHEVSHFRQLWVLMAFIFAASYMLAARSAEQGIVESPHDE